MDDFFDDIIPIILSDTAFEELQKEKELASYYKQQFERLKGKYQRLESRYFEARAAAESSEAERLEKLEKQLGGFLNEGVFLERKKEGLELIPPPFATAAEELELSADFIKEMIDPNNEDDADLFYHKFIFGRPMEGEEVDWCPHCFCPLEAKEPRRDRFFTRLSNRFCYRENEYYDQYCPNCGYEIPSPYDLSREKTILLEEGLVTPEIIVHIVMEKYALHRSLISQDMAFDTLGVELSAATLACWLRHACKTWLIPLHDALMDELFKEDMLYMETLTVISSPTKLMTDEEEEDKTAAVWAFHAGRFCHRPIVLLDVSFQDSPSDRIAEKLQQYKGTLMTGSSFPAQKEAPNCTFAGSWFVVRLMLEDLLEESTVIPETSMAIETSLTREPPLPLQIGVELCRQLYEVEERIASFQPEIRLFIREKESAPMVDHLIEWASRLLEVPEEMAEMPYIEEVARYILRYEDSLRMFLKDGRLEIDHTCAVDLLNKTFLEEETGWKITSTRHYAGLCGGIAALSVIETAQACGLDPERYLLYYIGNMAACQNDPGKISRFLPWCAPEECENITK